MSTQPDNVIHLTATRETCVGHAERLIVDQAEVERHERAAKYFSEVAGRRESINRIDHRIADLGHAHAAVSAEHAGMRHEITRSMLRPWVYWVLIVVAALAELPLNETAFTAMRLAGFETTIAAGFLALLNVLAANFAGRTFRHIEAGSEFAKDRAMLVIVLVVVLAAVVAVSLKRAEFMSFDRGTEMQWSDVAAFAALQALFFGVGAAIAFAARPRSVVLDRVNRDGRDYADRLDACWKARADIAGPFNKSLAICRTTLAKIEYTALRRISEYRWELGRNGAATRWWMQQPVTRDVFIPIELGKPVDPNPQSVDRIVTHREA